MNKCSVKPERRGLFVSKRDQIFANARQTFNELLQLGKRDNDRCNSVIADGPVSIVVLGTKVNPYKISCKEFDPSDHAGNEKIRQIWRNPRGFCHAFSHRKNTGGEPWHIATGGVKSILQHPASIMLAAGFLNGVCWVALLSLVFGFHPWMVLLLLLSTAALFLFTRPTS